MCQCQLSSSRLPSEAATPPWAATVCDRVGNTLESTATLRSARASSSAARNPEPPPPTITASKVRTGSAISQAPEYLYGPDQIPDQSSDHEHVQGEPQAGILDVVHEDVANADPRMEQEAQQEQHRGIAHDRQLPQCLPAPVIEPGRACQNAQHHERIDAHHHCGDALREPVAQAVMGADDFALNHISAPKTSVDATLAASTAQLVARAAASSVP